MITTSELTNSLQSTAKILAREKIRQHKLKELTVGPPLLEPCVPFGTADWGVSSERRFLSAEHAKLNQSDKNEELLPN